MSDPSAIGIMEGAYFVSKRDLLDWLRNDFGLNIAKIEECGNGVTHLKILDRMFPGKVPLKKVKATAKQEWECLHNWKIIQAVFQDCAIRKHLDIDRLAKCGYLDNLEFLQWMRSFYDKQCGGSIIDDDGSASVASLGISIASLPRQGLQSSSSNTRPVSRPASSTPNSRLTNGSINNNKGRAEHGSYTRPATRPLVSPQRAPAGVTRSFTRRDDELARTIEENARLKAELEERNKAFRMIQAELENTEKESHFYFGKLRRLELLSSEVGRTSFTIQEVQEILFTEEELPEASLGLQGDDDGEVVVNETNAGV